MFNRGYLTLFRLRGIPVRAHFTLPIGVLLFSGFRFAPGLWVSVLGLIFVHEMGHALLVHRAGLVNLGIDLTGFGGSCRWAGEPSPIERAGIAWGGVLAQLVVLALALPVLLFMGWPATPFLSDLLYGLIQLNAVLIAINLIPFSPLDGAEAWPWFRLVYRRAQRTREWKQRLRRDADQPQTLKQALRSAEEETRR